MRLRTHPWLISRAAAAHPPLCSELVETAQRGLHKGLQHVLSEPGGMTDGPQHKAWVSLNAVAELVAHLLLAAPATRSATSEMLSALLPALPHPLACVVSKAIACALVRMQQTNQEVLSLVDGIAGMVDMNEG
ncbi:hypothetical protein GUITHDRAFT_154702 [Guillardia theta CCMP2712]|uniref:Uncharacterized protein n=2 Tax=Guillardia theta TaxID=55529 RepID=L1IQR6_GUITC|nr:hypothetical protein GUITHDRAFT_154702 [Guillardia theta CCMP2712]EKX38417.1 hypothetical protein GUITHDRAFT_154702 [Guillardia theta CCMP2712]|eukprot:XP_005825397.1 hypothetical protein GUITHDRAFT_154702 [Guillardia theta CCMP2712]